MTKIDEKMRKALADYTGSVTRCRLGRARAPTNSEPPMNDAVEWLKQHRTDKPTKDARAERKRLRRARAQRERLSRRNAAIRNQFGN
jgi:hypothetical protein